MSLSRIGANDSLIQPIGMMVRAFDGTKTLACGETDLKALIGPCKFKISFFLVDIPAIFNLLLASPEYTWLEPFHIVCIRGSNLYCTINFIPVMTEEDIPMSTSIMVLFIDIQQTDSTSKYHLSSFYP